MENKILEYMKYQLYGCYIRDIMNHFNLKYKIVMDYIDSLQIQCLVDADISGNMTKWYATKPKVFIQTSEISL